MIKKCASPICTNEYDTWDPLFFKGRWCSRDCYLSALDEHLERKWEEEMEGRLMEDDPMEDR